MQKNIPIKNHLEEIRLITHRVIASIIIIILLVCLLIFRLSYLQLLKHDLYTTLSKKNSLDLVPLEPTRGLIFDRNGVLLAENIPVFSLDIIPDKVSNMLQTLSQLAKIISLSDTEIAQFQKALKQHRRFDEIPLKLRLTENEVAKFSENQYRFPGVLVKARLIRHYPFGESFIHVLGYVGRINTQELDEIDPANYSASNYIGKLGIEKYYEDELHGTVGYEQVENDASGEPVRILNQIKTEAGHNLHLTLDSKLQLAIEKAMGKLRGAVVAIQPSTGQILAMVSQPTYDPNLFVAGISSNDFKSLQDSPDKPLYNRALRGLYPLGSTIKPYIALQALNTGVITPKYSINDPGWYKLENSKRLFRDSKHLGHGIVNVSRAITVSCDIFFYGLAYKMGIQSIDNILGQFGFGKLSGVDLEEELPGVVASPEWKKRVKGVSWYPGDTINSGIGQGNMQATPLQLASAVSTLSMRGKHFTPYLLMADQEPSKPLTIEPPHFISQIKIDSRVWDTVIRAMQGVISADGGTAYRFGKDASYTAAAKTGTAQLVKKRHYEEDHENQDDLPEYMRDHSLFIVFAPIENPKIALAIIIENHRGLAVGVARKILDYYLANIPISEPIDDPLKTDLPPIQLKQPVLRTEIPHGIQLWQ